MSSISQLAARRIRQGSEWLGRSAVPIVLTACVVTLFYGLVRERVRPGPLWLPAARDQLLWLAVGVSILGASVHWIVRWPVQLTWGVLLIAVPAIAMGVAPMGAAVLIVGGSVSLGQLVARHSLRVSLSPLGEFALYCLTGLAVYLELISLAAHYRINTPVVYAAALIAPILLNRRPWVDVARRLVELSGKTVRPPLAAHAVFVGLVAVLGIHFIYVLLPERFYDPLVTHLFVPHVLRSDQQWSFDFKNLVWATFPMGTDWLFALGFMFSSESGARLVNLLLFLLALLLFWELTDVIKGQLKRLLVVLLFASTPVAFLESGALMVDNGYLVFTIGMFLLVTRVRPELAWRTWIVFGLLAGALLQSKVIAGMVLAPLFALWAVEQWRSGGPRRAALATAVSGLVGGIAGLIPYAYAYGVTGNPIYPMFNGLFKSPYYPVENFLNSMYVGKLSWRILYDMTFHSSRFIEGGDGAFGFQFLVLLPAGAVLALRRHRITPIMSALVLILVYPVILFMFQQYIRYLYPVMPMATLLCGLLLVPTGSARFGRVAMGVFVLVILLNVAFLPAAGWILRDFSLRAALLPDARRALITSEVPMRVVLPAANAPGAERPRVVILGNPAIADLVGDPLIPNWYNPAFYSELTGAKDEDALLRVFRERRVTHVVFESDGAGGIATIPPDIARLALAVLAKHGTPVAQAGRASLYRIDPALIYDQDQLANGDFRSGLEHWRHYGAVEMTAQGIRLDPGAILTQTATEIRAGVNYHIAGRVRCPTAGGSLQARLSWSNKDSVVSDEDASVWCTVAGEEVAFSKVWTAPRESESAVVTLAALRPAPVVLERVTLRR
jgi:Dolichyl-phosphate-mannose-protein mannosyltransferase